ncbi:DNA primase [Mycobacterium phage Fowlmouth]|uniref:DNA primase/polymerase n=1 Tax=Mycobacterium phage Fowlmouth TaxID=2419978 RepID=A0A3G2KGG0_9CAUD|nr:DNA primase [Mycobacterium phage Fowlmouth]AYN58050.1 DNA primase/polymerase [Mycobacterium phage Fowlmouth]
MSAPRSINSGTPFTSTARDYIDKGWGVLPLPERRKEFPPTGFTGRAGKFADDDDLTRWLVDPKYSKGNIALRVGNELKISGERYEVIGIDVDAHSKKKGAEELSQLERKLGELPETWISSARTDGNSGIRFFLVPYGYGFKGQASQSIDIVQRVHRYAVVYPSWHPETKNQYFWYEPGNPPDGEHVTTEIPSAFTLPLLPDKWIDFLTLNRTADFDFGDGRYGIDLDISGEALAEWIKEKFIPPLANEPGGMCAHMKKTVAQWIQKIEESPTNHNIITSAHWNLVRTASEGHSGYEAALAEVEAVWFKDIMAKGKRPAHVVEKEMKRSRDGQFRKLKAKADSYEQQGLSLFAGGELCMSAEDLAPDKEDTKSGDDKHWIFSVPLLFKDFDPKSYDKNDVGQAQHFYDRVQDNVRYLADYNGWIIYDGLRWHIDDFTHVRDLFHRAVVVPSKKRARSLWKASVDAITSGRLVKTDPEYLELIRDAKKLDWVAEHYGNDNKIKAALNCMKAIPGVGMRYGDLNWDTTILAMPNGKVLKLDEPKTKPEPNAKGFRIIRNEKRFLTTYSTAVEYRPTKLISDREKNLWAGYLKLFLPDLKYRRFVQKALGYMLIGGNPEKLAMFLVGQSNTGKSTMLQAIQGVMNDYGATFQPNAIFKDSGTGNNPELGNLLHKRGIFSSESGSQRIHANPLKRNTGGDKISVTRKYANDQIIGIPHFTPIVATNQAPTIDDADEALVKRILVLPFTTRVPELQNDKRADVELERDARHAVLNWLVNGYRLYIREGLAHEQWHPWSIAATAEFANELSDVATFLGETCVAADDDQKAYLTSDILSETHAKTRARWSKVSMSGLYLKYQHECAESGQNPMPPRLFAKKVRQVFGVTVIPVKVDGKVSKNYLGLRYINEAMMNQVQG